MGIQDFEVFVRERLRVWDENLDLSAGSPIDAQVIQPLLRRIGVDPFTLDASTFIVTRLTQEFPDLAFSEGDAVSDLMAKPALLLWDPIIREIQRVKNVLSFKDPSTLTTEEAEALGANLFATRDAGSFARGVARIYFTQPQPQSITHTNFFTTKSGLHFFPTDTQSIKSTEMLLNLEGDLYYFDVNVIAEAAGDEYNIGPSELSTVANIASAVRVTNKVRFRFGLPEEDAATFIARSQQNLTEHSLVTARGIGARLPEAFPEITRLNVVGFNDPEMQRDIITGGSYGPIRAAGVDAAAAADGLLKTVTSWVRMASASFTTLIGPPGPVTGWVVTLFNMFGGSPVVKDVAILRVVDSTTLELAEATIVAGVFGCSWALRKLELTLSGIPGGILFPDTATGTVSVPSDQIHIGGATDIHVRGADVDTSSLVLDVVYDDVAEYEGTSAVSAVLFGVGYVGVSDYVLDTDYFTGDQTYLDFEQAGLEGWELEILEGAAAGKYRVTSFSPQISGSPALFTVTPVPLAPPGSYRWRMVNEVNIDLVEPKQTRLHGSTGQTVQNLAVFSTSPATDFSALGISIGDTLRLENGLDQGDFTVKAVPAPFFTQLTLDRPLSHTSSGLTFSIFRPNSSGGVLRPMLRVTGIDLLDTSGQPVGSKVPYARPVNALSRAFQNSGDGVKLEVRDARLGLLSQAEPLGGFDFGAGGNLSFTWTGAVVDYVLPVVGIMGVAALVTAINIGSQIQFGYDIAATVSYGGVDYVGILPFAPRVSSSPTDAAIATVLFGDTYERTTRDIRSVDMENAYGGWSSITPTIDPDLDAVMVVDGPQTGFYKDQAPGNPDVRALLVSHDFSPELSRIVRVGARSIGSVRVFFLEPTSASVDGRSLFTSSDANGTPLNFVPDPTVERQVYPALPNGEKPLDGAATGISELTCASLDFVAKGVRVGDQLVVDFTTITGSVNLADPVLTLALKQLRISMDGQPDKFVTFVNDVGTAGAVSRKGVADQINSAVGQDICKITETSPGVFNLVFNPTSYFIIRQQSVSPDEANTLLGFSNISDTNNLSDNAGTYPILTVAPGGDVTKLDIDGTFTTISPAPGYAAQQFSIRRVGEQRICSTTMKNQTTTGGLYYWDVELVSEGPGDLWNIGSDLTMLVSGYRSDGYYLVTRNPSLTFSTAEDVQLVLSRSILEPGVDDDLDNATQLSGQSLSISYDFSSLVQGSQNFISSESERVVNNSPLARHLIPHYVRFDVVYAGGSLSTEILPPLQDYIRALPPDVPMESSDVQKIVSDKGATSIQNPIELMAVVCNVDRTVELVRSKNSLTTGRLAAFMPDVINLTRRNS